MLEFSNFINKKTYGTIVEQNDSDSEDSYKEVIMETPVMMKNVKEEEIYDSD